MTTTSNVSAALQSSTSGAEELVCHYCRAPIPPTAPGHVGTGYGRDKDNNIICYRCCGDMDLRDMRERGRTTLYLAGPHSPESGKPRWTVSNWPGTLVYPCRVSHGRHNIARTRTDVWFKDADGNTWHGVQYGEWTQLTHCRRLKSKVKQVERRVPISALHALSPCTTSGDSTVDPDAV